MSIPAGKRIAVRMLAGLGALLLLPGAALADYTGKCGEQLTAVAASINGAVFKNARDQSNLLVKLDAANAKITLLKYSDAVDKLVDISDAATALANAAKPKLDDATEINHAVSAAITCVAP